MHNTQLRSRSSCKKHKGHSASLLPNIDMLFGKPQVYSETPYYNLSATGEWKTVLHQHGTGKYEGSHTVENKISPPFLLNRNNSE